MGDIAEKVAEPAPSKGCHCRCVADMFSEETLGLLCEAGDELTVLSERTAPVQRNVSDAGERQKPCVAGIRDSHSPATLPVPERHYPALREPWFPRALPTLLTVRLKQNKDAAGYKMAGNQLFNMSSVVGTSKGKVETGFGVGGVRFLFHSVRMV